MGFSAGSVLGWAVFAPTTGVPAGALAGEYVGVSADVGVGRRRECPARRLEPHHRAAAAFASGIRCRERSRQHVVAQAALALVNCKVRATSEDRAGRSTPVQRNGGLHDLPGTVGVDIHALPSVARHHDEIGREAGAFDVELETVATRIADRCAARAAGAFGPATTDLILFVSRELADQIEIVAVACAAKLQLDITWAPSGTIGRVATDSLRGPVLRLERS